jgi:GT2 family glycosyltransferase
VSNPAASIRASVVVPTYRRHDLLCRLISALLAQRFEGDLFEILICDDAADPQTAELVASFASRDGRQVRYLPVTQSHGPAAARNVGWRAARGEIIAFTDDDCVPDPDWLAAGVAAFEPAVDAVWGRLEMPLPAEPTDYARDAAGLAEAVFVTANCFCRRSALERVGGFDERYRMAWREDSDLYFSLLKHGCRVLHCPAALVMHPIRPAPWGVSLRQQQKCQFDALLFKKHPDLYRRHIPGVPTWYYLAAGLPLAALAALAIGFPVAALMGFVSWLALTAWFCFRRLRGTTHRFLHVLEMAITSAFIPLLSVYWNWRGRLQYREVSV